MKKHRAMLQFTCLDIIARLTTRRRLSQTTVIDDAR